MKNKTQIILADDHQLMCDGLICIIQENPQYEIAAVVNNGRELLQKLNGTTPDLIIFDLSMPIMNGIEAAERIKKDYPQIKLIGMSMYFEETIQNKLKAIGVNGFFPKLEDSEVFLDCIQRVINNENVFVRPNGAIDNDIPKLNITDNKLEKYKLSKREIEILFQIKEGKTSKQIAESLNLSYFTIETHRKRISKKLHIKEHNGLFKYAIENL